ncbi:solute carrier family 35 member F3-like [Ylistrum balloti]|uniref:solute carrier family 35 member F3-like n=1 Tax=Ylistrum balloti TaxID=509963 RepID=UPI0029058641|nr:solute carrier family 35 member F3-like [Ylistrum balloti]
MSRGAEIEGDCNPWSIEDGSRGAAIEGDCNPWSIEDGSRIAEIEGDCNPWSIEDGSRIAEIEGDCNPWSIEDGSRVAEIEGDLNPWSIEDGSRGVEIEGDCNPWSIEDGSRIAEIEESSESAQNTSTILDATTRLRNIICCIILMIAVAVVWILATQFVRETYSPGHFEAPFLLMYIWTICLIPFYPIFVLVRFVYKKRQSKPIQEFRSHIRLYYTDGERQLRQYIGLSVMFCILWSLMQFTYIRALDPELLSPTGVAALYSTYHSFVYLLSWIVLFEKFVAIRIMAMIFSISGMVLSAYAGGFGSTSMWGVILSVSASATMSVFKVLYKKFIGIPDYGQISLFTSLIGVGNVLCLWPVVLSLCFTKTEVITRDVPWAYIIGSSIAISVLHVLLHYIELALFDVFLGLGFLLGIVMSALIDYLWRGIYFSGMEVAAMILTSFGILLVSLPDHCPTDFSMLTMWCRRRKRCEVQGTPQSTADTSGTRWRRSIKK